MTTTTSIPNVIDALLTKWRGLAVKVAGVDSLIVFDGMPGSYLPDTFACVGGLPGNTVNGAQDWASLGAAYTGTPASRDEKYTITCYARSYVGGSDDAGGTGFSDAQKTARDNAFAVVSVLEDAVRTDPVLRNVTSVFPDGQGLKTGWLSFGTRYDVEQTPEDDASAEKGRWANVIFEVAVYKRLYS